MLLAKSAGFFLLLGIFCGLCINSYLNGIKNQVSSRQISPYAQYQSISAIQPVAKIATASAGGWQTLLLPVKYQSEFSGPLTLHLQVKIPTGWTLTTTPQPWQESNLIQNCAEYEITNPNKDCVVNLIPLCKAYTITATQLPLEKTTVFAEIRQTPSGPGNHYRYRWLSEETRYTYSDTITDATQINQSKDQAMDMVLIGFAPPNENRADYFFIGSRLTTTLKSTKIDPAPLLLAADQIAASLELK